MLLDPANAVLFLFLFENQFRDSLRNKTIVGGIRFQLHSGLWFGRRGRQCEGLKSVVGHERPRPQIPSHKHPSFPDGAGKCLFLVADEFNGLSAYGLIPGESLLPALNVFHLLESSNTSSARKKCYLPEDCNKINKREMKNLD